MDDEKNNIENEAAGKSSDESQKASSLDGDRGSDRPNVSKENSYISPGRVNPNKPPVPGLNNDVAKKIIANKASENSTVQSVQRAAESAKKIGDTFKKVATSAKSVLSAVVSALVNPVTWIIAAAIIVLVYMYSLTLVIGKAEDDCETGEATGGEMNWPGDDASIEEKGIAIGNWLTSNGFTGNGGKPMNAKQAGALIGIMIAETGTLNPSLIQNNAGPGPNATNAQMKAFAEGHTGTNMGAIGLFQQRQGRALRMIEIAETSGRKWNDPNVQMEHFLEEMNSGGYNSKNLSDNGFWKDGQTVEYYSDLLNRYYVVSCRWHTDQDKRGCSESISNPREQGRRAVENGEKFAKLLEGNGKGTRTASSKTSKKLSSTSSVNEGATTTQFPGQEGLKPHTLEYAKHIGQKFGLATIGGYRPEDPYPDHPSGYALDIMVTKKETGDAIAQYFIDNESAFAPIYMIWYQRYYNFPNGGRSPTGQWGAMEDRGDPTQNHMDHVHILFKDTPGDGNWSDSDTNSCDVEESSSGTGDWAMPVCGATTSSGYGWRIHPIYGVPKFHAGEDIPIPAGQDIKAAKGGTVKFAAYDSGCGNFVVIAHEDVNMMSGYCHMLDNSTTVKVGDKVNTGDVIGKVGSTGASTGAHLHFQINDMITDQWWEHTVNPREFLEEKGVWSNEPC